MVDGEVHRADVSRRSQLIAVPVRRRPDKEVGALAFLQWLNENLVLAPFDLEGRTSGSDRRDSFWDLYHRQMIQSGFDADNAVWIGGADFDLLGQDIGMLDSNSPKT